MDQPEATGRVRGADRIWPVGAEDEIDGGAAIHRAGAERVTGSASHEARQIRLAGDHLRRRRPVRPFGFARDVEKPLPLESFAADADAIAYRAAVALDQLEVALRGRGDDGARRFRRTVVHRLLPEFRIQFHGIIGQTSRLVADVRLPGMALRG